MPTNEHNLIMYPNRTMGSIYQFAQSDKLYIYIYIYVYGLFRTFICV